MCIIVLKPKGTKMPNEEIINNCWQKNEDGAGYMLVENERVKIRKGFMNLRSFKDSIKSYGDLTNKTVVLHFRISTSGGIRPETTHPYPVKSKKKFLSALKFYSSMGMCHNGTINIKHNKKEENDTMRMVYKILANDFIKNNLETFAIRELIENYIDNSKLVFLKPDESYIIYNESKGEWKDGIWYSNTGYKRKSFTKDLPWWYWKNSNAGYNWLEDDEVDYNDEELTTLYSNEEIEIINELEKRNISKSLHEQYLLLVEMGWEFENIKQPDLKIAKDIINSGVQNVMR